MNVHGFTLSNECLHAAYRRDAYVTLRPHLRRLLPLTGLALFVVAWQAAVAVSPTTLVPTPWQALRAIVELAEAETLYRAPQHPYTRTLLAASVTTPPRHPAAGRTLVASHVAVAA